MFGPELMRFCTKPCGIPRRKENPTASGLYLPAEDLRLGADYQPMLTATHFRYPDDEGQFPRAMVRCLGIGACRKGVAGTMQPALPGDAGGGA